MSSTRDPREDVAAGAGMGGYGKDFAPNDKEYQVLRMKARDVMNGTVKFTNDELHRTIARLLLAR